MSRTHRRRFAAVSALAFAPSCWSPVEHVPARPVPTRAQHLDRVVPAAASRGTPAPAAAPVKPVPAEVPEVFADPKGYALELRGASLAQAFEMLGTMGRVNLVLQGDFGEPVAGAMPEVTLQSAFATLCRTHDCTVERNGAVWVVERADPSRDQVRTFELRNVPAQSLAAELKALLGDEASVVVNPGSNVIWASAPAERLDRAAEYVARVDRRERQVLLECVIVEIDETDLVRLGTEVAANDISIDPTTWTLASSFLSPSAATVLTGSADDFPLTAALEALEQHVHLQVLSRPLLLSLNNKEAKLKVVSQVPYIDATTSTTGSSGNNGSVSVQEVAFKEIGLDMTVTPTIQEDGHIHLHLVKKLSEQTGTFLDIPVVDSRELEDWCVVREGETLRIGDILRDRLEHEVRGIPGLMDLPLLGRAFRFEDDDRKRVDLEILITPRIIESSPLVPPAAEDSVVVELPKS